jgi:Holliday junction resolvase RusA-like endonuclease
MMIELPLDVYYSKNKKFILNLNNYRNAHYRVLANAKKIYSENLVDGISYPMYEKPVRLVYTYYAKTKRRLDVSNPCSIIDKFTCDALVKAKVLEDDSFEQIKEVIYKFGGIDKDRPRCVLEIEEM